LAARAIPARSRAAVEGPFGALLSAELRSPPAGEVVQLALARAHAFAGGEHGNMFSARS